MGVLLLPLSSLMQLYCPVTKICWLSRFIWTWQSIWLQDPGTARFPESIPLLPSIRCSFGCPISHEPLLSAQDRPTPIIPTSDQHWHPEQLPWPLAVPHVHKWHFLSSKTAFLSCLLMPSSYSAVFTRSTYPVPSTVFSVTWISSVNVVREQLNSWQSADLPIKCCLPPSTFFLDKVTAPINPFVRDLGLRY